MLKQMANYLERIFKNFREISRSKRKENEKFFTHLKRKDPKRLNEQFHAMHKAVFAETDCLQCARCCRSTGPLLTKKDIQRIAKKQAKKYFDQQISKAIDNEVGKSYFGTRGKINKHVDDAITGRFKDASKDKHFDEAVVKVAKRVLKAMHDMHFKRKNLIDDMPVPKS